MLLSDRFIHDTGYGYPKRYIICLIHRGKDRRLRFHPPRPHARCSKSRSGSRLPPSRRPIRVNFRKVLPKIAFFSRSATFRRMVFAFRPWTGSGDRPSPPFPSGRHPCTWNISRPFARHRISRQKNPTAGYVSTKSAASAAAPHESKRNNNMYNIYYHIYKTFNNTFRNRLFKTRNTSSESGKSPVFQTRTNIFPQKILIYLKRFILLQ